MTVGEEGHYEPDKFPYFEYQDEICERYVKLRSLIDILPKIGRIEEREDDYGELVRRHYSDDLQYYFDEGEAYRAVCFFLNELHHVEGPKADEPFFLEPWQQLIIELIFGWKRTCDDTRKYREVFIFIPRKNGKSFLGAGLALIALFALGERGARVISAAGETEQASLIYDVAKQIVDENPNFSEITVPLRKQMSVPALAANYKVVSADAKTKHGRNLSAVIVDELHVQPSRDLVDVLFTSVGARTEPLKIMLTTAGFDTESICFEYYEFGKDVLDGTHEDPEFLPVIFETDENDDWRDESTWYKANPNLGVSISLDYLRSECRKAIARPSYENTFKNLHLNKWTEQKTRWLPVELWDENAFPINLEELQGLPCWVGCDLSSKADVTAVVFTFLIDEVVKCLPFFWVPGGSLKLRKKRDRVNYDTWIKQGFVEPIEGTRIDYSRIRKKINDLSKFYQIKKINFDPWGAQNLMNELESDGFDVQEIPPGFKHLSEPTKEIEALLLSGQLHHGGNPALRWMFKNVSVLYNTEGDVRISKKDSKGKIDGIMALSLGIHGILHREVGKGSVYETRGIRTV